jgi:hypothetical protein
MAIHPKINMFIVALKEERIDNMESENERRRALDILYEKGATSTEAMVVFHQGYGFKEEDAENIVKQSEKWKPEDIQDIAYQTFLYLSYNG